MSLCVRSMLEEDLPDVLEIQKGCYTESKQESRESFQKKLQTSPATSFVARYEHALVGYLVAIPRKLNDLPPLNETTMLPVLKPDCLYLHDLAVSPKHQGLGVGAALVVEFFRLMEKLSLQYAALVAIQNAESYWANYGFYPADPVGRSKESLLSYGKRSQLMLRQLDPSSLVTRI